MQGAAARGVPEEVAEKVFLQVVGFSEFGFPKSHAAAFGLLAYQSAWLRHYYPTEYYVGLFNNQPMGFYSLDALGRDARRHGIETLLPHVNKSGVRATAEGKDLRIGLGFVRGWGEEIAEAVVAERDKNGPFRSLPDFLRRTPTALKRPAIENLIWVGGFDDFGLTRRELLWQAGLWLGPETDPERTGGRDDHAQVEMELADPYADLPFAAMQAEEQMVAEYRMLRFSASLHPLALIRDQLPPGTVSLGQLKGIPNGSTVQLAGIVVARQRPQTAKGYVFILFEDEDGPINVIVKPKTYQRDRSTIRMEPFVAVKGRLQKDGETINVIAYEVKALRLGGGVPMPGTQEWWPDRGKFRKAAAEGQTAAPSPAFPSGPGPAERKGPEPDQRERHRQAAQEEAATERRKEARRRGRPVPKEIVREEAPGSHQSSSPELPKVREWWGKPEEARKSPFYYLTALRQNPPGTKSWG
jgi:error-prone DNA polymerase